MNPAGVLAVALAVALSGAAWLWLELWIARSDADFAEEVAGWWWEQAMAAREAHESAADDARQWQRFAHDMQRQRDHALGEAAK